MAALLRCRPLLQRSVAGLPTSPWRHASSKAAASAANPKKKYLNDPSLRVRIVPMLTDNYGAER
jgi:hypothetical protein